MHATTTSDSNSNREVIKKRKIEQQSPAVDCRRSAKSTREAKLVAVLLRVAFIGVFLVKRVVLPIRLPQAPAPFVWGRTEGIDCSAGN